jgi:uncharacterized coiled-coil DUF342 family protein
MNINSKELLELIQIVVKAEVKEQLTEVHETFEKYNESYNEMHSYLLKSTQDLEQRPEEVRREIKKSLTEHKQQLDLLNNRTIDLTKQVEKENGFIFERIKHIEGTMVVKKEGFYRKY